MNSQFKNSNLGFYLYAAIIVFITAASIIVFWYMVAGYKLGTYPEDTIIGSVYIGGLEEDDVKAKVENRVDRWVNDDTVVFELTYQGYHYEFDRDLMFFDIDLSTSNMKPGVTNILYASYQGNDRNTVTSELNALPFLTGLQSSIDFNKIVSDILIDAGFMKSYSSKKVEDYFLDLEAAYTVVNTDNLRVFNGVDVDSFIESVNAVYPDGKIMVNKKELFDVVSTFNSEMSDNEMSVLSTGMMGLLLETNFDINEVHYSPTFDRTLYTIDNYPYLGHNARVNRIVDHGFSFYNPNDSAYYFTVEKIDGTNIQFTLHGLEFVDDISVSILKTPVDFISQTTSDSSITQPGYKGAIIEVTRVIINVDGDVIYDKKIVFEFYLPVKEIVFQIN